MGSRVARAPGGGTPSVSDAWPDLHADATPPKIYLSCASASGVALLSNGGRGPHRTRAACIYKRSQNRWCHCLGNGPETRPCGSPAPAPPRIPSGGPEATPLQLPTTGMQPTKQQATLALLRRRNSPPSTPAQLSPPTLTPHARRLSRRPSQVRVGRSFPAMLNGCSHNQWAGATAFAGEPNLAVVRGDVLDVREAFAGFARGSGIKGVARGRETETRRDRHRENHDARGASPRVVTRQ